MHFSRHWLFAAACSLSLVAEHGLQGTWPSAVVALRLSYPAPHGIVPHQGPKLSPAWAAGSAPLDRQRSAPHFFKKIQATISSPISQTFSSSGTERASAFLCLCLCLIQASLPQIFSVCSFVRAAVTKYHRAGGLNNRNVFSYNSRG